MVVCNSKEQAQLMYRLFLEKLSGTMSQPKRGGLPPCGRGKDEGVTETDVSVGITPAWAGKRFAKLVNQKAN